MEKAKPFNPFYTLDLAVSSLKETKEKLEEIGTPDLAEIIESLGDTIDEVASK